MSQPNRKLHQYSTGLLKTTKSLLHLQCYRLVISINLFLLSDDPEKFNKAAHFMASNPIIKIFEVILFLAFIIHIIWGFILQIKNWLARPKRYTRYYSSQTSFFSKYMIYLGGIILIFLIIHFMNFYFVKLGWVQGDSENFYGMAHDLFKIPVYTIIYIICFL